MDLTKPAELTNEEIANAIDNELNYRSITRGYTDGIGMWRDLIAEVSRRFRAVSQN